MVQGSDSAVVSLGADAGGFLCEVTTDQPRGSCRFLEEGRSAGSLTGRRPVRTAVHVRGWTGRFEPVTDGRVVFEKDG